jgi:histidinol dehydrogenase
LKEGFNINSPSPKERGWGEAMEIFNYSDLSKADIQKLVQRNVDPANEIRTLVEEVIAHVKQHGDRALFDYAYKFDKVELTKLYLDKA